MEYELRRLLNYQTQDGRKPFDRWFKELRDKKGRSVIATRLERFEKTGNPGYWRALGEGLCELKIDFGPGYRVYYGEDGGVLVILLCGGDKDKQNKDIRKAREYWDDYRTRRG